MPEVRKNNEVLHFFTFIKTKAALFGRTFVMPLQRLILLFINRFTKFVDMRLFITASILIVCSFFQMSFAQDGPREGLDFEVDRIDPPLSLNKEKLMSAERIQDLNKHFKPSWVREYHSVKIGSFHEGRLKYVKSDNDRLSQAQKDFMVGADVGSEITVKIEYIPENTLKENDAKEYDFSFLVNPEVSAVYPEGLEALKAYLKEAAVDKIPDGVITGYALAAVKFVVDEVGEIVDANLFFSSNDESVDKVLLDAVTKMPNWIPAQYANGHRVKQEFAFSVGNRESCVVNLLNVAEE